MEEESLYFGNVEEYGHQFGTWRKDTFLALSNFKVDVVLEVSSPPEDPSGYIFKVTYRDGKVLGYVHVSHHNVSHNYNIISLQYSNAFVSCKDTEDRIKWITCLRQVLACPMLRCNATNVQLGAYLMTKLECVYREGCLLKKKPVTCIG